MSDLISRLRKWESGPQNCYCAPSPRLYGQAADEIERLGHVAAGRLRWVATMIDDDVVSLRAREWADELDPNLQNASINTGEQS